MIVIGAGGHGLATAYYLAKEHGITDIAVLEKGWLGGGNTGRNTTIIRSNYLWDESARIYDHAVKLWEGLSQELNFNVMFSQRGVLHLAHTVHDLQEVKRRRHANRLNGVDSEFLSPEQIKELEPLLDTSRERALPDPGRVVATARRHRAPRRGRLGLRPRRRRHGRRHHPELRGDRHPTSAAAGSRASRPPGAPSRCDKLALVAAGHSSVIADMAGFRLPIESFPLQALVSEPVKPCVNTVIMSNAVHGYISQSDKGELVIGAGTDQFISYSQRGSFHIIEHTLQAIVELFPASRACGCCASGAAIVDVTPGPQPDHRPDPGREPVHQLRLGHRRLQGDPGLRATCSPIPWPGASRTRSPRRSRSSASRAAGWSTSTAPPPWRTEDSDRWPRTIARPDLTQRPLRERISAPGRSDKAAACCEERRFDELDLDHLIEEVGGLGAKRERSAVLSRARGSSQHFLKLEYSPAPGRAAGWQETVRTQRDGSGARSCRRPAPGT